MLRTTVAALAIGVAIGVVYQPSLNRVWVLDQTMYFAERQGDTSLSGGLALADFAASRRYWKGDEALYRPGFYVWLGVATTLFSYHHVWWNVANLVLHGLVALLLYRLLMTIRPSAFALPLAVMFAVLKPPLEIVVWNHKGGYLIAAAAVAIALGACYRLLTATSPSQRATVTFVAAFAVGVFFQETVVIIAALAAALVIWTEKRASGGRIARGRAALLASPVLAYAALYLLHAARVVRITYVDRPGATSLLDGGILLGVPFRTAGVLARWFRETALPSGLQLDSGAFGEMGQYYVPRLTVTAVLEVIVLGALLFVLARVVTMRQVKRVGPFLLLIGGGILAHAGLVTVGRSLVEATTLYSHQLYLFSLMLIAGIYAAMDVERLTPRLAGLAGAVVAMFALLHGIGARAVTAGVGRDNAPASRLLQRVEAFVDARRDEPGFTFALSPHPAAAEAVFTLREGYPDDPNAPSRDVPITEILFARYYDAARPKYVLDVR